MRKLVLHFTTLLLLSQWLQAAQGPSYKWGGNFGGTAGDETVNALKTDASGNVYVAGKFTGQNVDFDPGAGTTLLSSNGGTDIFLAKYSAQGQLLWAKAIGGTGADEARALAIAPNGAVWFTGTFTGLVDFDPSGTTVNLAANTTVDRDIFLSKFDSTGNYQWAGSLNSPSSNETVNGIAINPVSGEIHLIGMFSGNLDVSPGPLNIIITSNGGEDIFVARYNSSGSNLGSLKLGGTSNDSGHGIAVDSASNVYLSGRFQGTVDFDFSGGNSNTISNGSYDAFVAKYSSSYALQFVNTFGGPGSWDISYALATDPAGNVYTTGNFSGTADANPGSATQYVYTSNGGTANGYVMKYTPAGALAWIYTASSSNESNLMALALDAAGNVYTTGNVAGTYDADNTSGAYLINQGGSQSTVLIKLSSTGSLAWATAQTSSSFGLGYAVAADAMGNVVVGGTFTGQADVDASPMVRQITSTANEFDCFITGYTNCNFPAAPAVASENVCEGQSITLSATGTGTLSWYTTATGNTYALPNGTTLTPSVSVSYFAQDSNACGSGPRSEKEIVMQTPPDVQASSLATILCEGEATTLTATGAANYLWNTSATTSDLAVLAALADTSFMVIGTAANGCADTAYISLQVNPVPHPVLSSVTDTLCQGASLWIYDTNGTASNSYTWSTGSVSDSVLVTPSAFTVYVVSVENSYGCIATDTATVEVSTTDPSVVQNGWQLTAVATDVTYQWVDCGTQAAISGANAASFTATAPGQYQLVATNTYGCTAASNCLTVEPSSVEVIDANLVAYPNPFSAQLWVDASGSLSGNDIAIELINTAGQTVLHHSVAVPSFVLNTWQLPAGVYLLHMHDGQHSFSKTLIKD